MSVESFEIERPCSTVIRAFCRELRVDDDYRRNTVSNVHRNSDGEVDFQEVRSRINSRQIPSVLRPILDGLGVPTELLTESSVTIDHEGRKRLTIVTRNVTGREFLRATEQLKIAPSSRNADGATTLSCRLRVDDSQVPDLIRARASESLVANLRSYRRHLRDKLARA